MRPSWLMKGLELDTHIGNLIRLGYQVGLAQDHSENPDVDFDHVYAVNGYGVQTHVTTEDEMKSLVESHDERVEQMRAADERRLADIGGPGV